MSLRHAPLTALGTVRQQLPWLGRARSEPLARFRDAVGEDLFAAARELASFLPEGDETAEAQRPAVLVLAATCLWAARRGSTRLPVVQGERRPLDEELERLEVPKAVRARVAALVEAAPEARGPAAALLGPAGASTPLVVDRGAVCVHRLVTREAALGGRLVARLARPPLPFDAGVVGPALADLLARPPRPGGVTVTLSDEQRLAVLAAAHQQLTVISGGPGTGKTSIVVSILRLLARLGVAAADIALAAPTGKAANRIDESVRLALGHVSSPAPVDEELAKRPPPSTTLHRLLGYSPTSDRFRHHEQNPLPHRVVLVDEASMIDLSLMDQLVRAVRPEARLVLLGDARQLPSVEAGAVLRDLVPSPALRPVRPWDGLVTVDGPDSQLPAPTAAAGRDLRNLGAVELRKSFRMDPRKPEGRAIYLASLAVRDFGSAPGREGAKAGGTPGLETWGDRRGTASALAFSGVERLDGPEAEREAFLARWFNERVAALPDFAARVNRVYRSEGHGLHPDDAADLQALDAHLQRFRVLCIVRSHSRASGAGQVNRRLRARLRELITDDRFGPGDLLPGTPLVMTRNDYALGLFNGDQGLAVWVEGPDDPEPRLRTVFRVAGQLQVFEPGALGEQVEPCWAMTVHKSQGSEFEGVALLLPTEDERAEGGEAVQLACREVVYTAMTRAKSSVVVVGSAAALEAAVRSSLERFSALGEASTWTTQGSAAQKTDENRERPRQAAPPAPKEEAPLPPRGRSSAKSTARAASAQRAPTEERNEFAPGSPATDSDAPEKPSAAQAAQPERQQGELFGPPAAAGSKAPPAKPRGGKRRGPPK